MSKLSESVTYSTGHSFNMVNELEISSFLDLNADHLSTMEVLFYLKANYGLDEKSSSKVISSYFQSLQDSKKVLN